MGFADFRAAFTAETPAEFTVTPTEGALRQKEITTFTIKFKAQQPGIVDGYLVIETEDFKKTWKVVGRTGQASKTNGEQAQIKKGVTRFFC